MITSFIIGHAAASDLSKIAAMRHDFDTGPQQWQTLTMWQLAMKTPADKDWMPVSTFGTVTEAARRIVELEGIPKNRLFLEFYVETNEFGTDEEAFRVFHYTGKRALYGIKRNPAN